MSNRLASAPCARQTAVPRAALLSQVSEQNLPDIANLIVHNARSGALPWIELLFSYVLGKPKPVVEPDVVDLCERKMLQQSAHDAPVLPADQPQPWRQAVLPPSTNGENGPRRA